MKRNREAIFTSYYSKWHLTKARSTYNAAGAPCVSAAHPCLVKRHAVSVCVVALTGTYGVYLVGRIGTQISAFSDHHTINFDAAFQ